MMLRPVRQWIAWRGDVRSRTEFVDWAADNRWALKRTPARDGWVMDRNEGRPNWRIEWGPAQRTFMGSHEFRVRLELPRMPDVQALVLDQPLLARLDKEVYQQFTGSVKTRFDDETPEEMRWLAMHAKLSPNQMGVMLRDRYGGLGDDPEWLSRRLIGPLEAALRRRADVVPRAEAAAAPFVLRFARGRLVIRQSARAPTTRLLNLCVDVASAAETALAPTARIESA